MITESILISIKKMLGIEKEDTDFDTDIIIHINTALMDLTQLGVGPEEGFMIQNDTNTWNEFLGYSSGSNSPYPYSEATSTKIEAVKTCVYLKVKLVFDPPESSSQIEAINRQIDRLEWRINVQAESTKKEG